jgi:hypothetical protein
VKRNPQAVMQLCLGAFKVGMREFSANVSGNDLVRVTGYMVRLSDLEKYRAEGSVPTPRGWAKKPHATRVSWNVNLVS